MGERAYQLGDFFISGLDGTRLSDKEKRIFEKLNPLGICLFAKNFRQDLPYEGWFKEYCALLEDIKTVSNRAELVISIDHEGGRVLRPPAPITAFPYPFYWKQDHELIAKAMATELKSLGVNLVYAPDADIHSNPKNPVIGPRAFATTAQKVLRYSSLVAQTFRSQGIIPCCKHFPGHGDTSSDSHFELPLIQHSKERLEELELVPFKEHIRNQIEVLMTAHLLIPALDKDLPATQSKAIIHDLLRKELGFNGVVISDSLHMKAVAQNFLQGQGVKQAINAGVDIMLMGSSEAGDLEQTFELSKKLSEAINKKSISEATLVQSFERISKLVKTLQHFSPKLLENDVFEGHQDLAKRFWPDERDHKKEFPSAQLLPKSRSKF